MRLCGNFIPRLHQDHGPCIGCEFTPASQGGQRGHTGTTPPKLCLSAELNEGDRSLLLSAAVPLCQLELLLTSDFEVKLWLHGRPEKVCSEQVNFHSNGQSPPSVPPAPSEDEPRWEMNRALNARQPGGLLHVISINYPTSPVQAPPPVMITHQPKGHPCFSLPLIP